MWNYLISRRNKKGILLFEVMLTVIILSVGLTLILRSFSTSLNAVKSAQHYTTASLLIEDKMWELENKGTIDADLDEEGQFPEPHQKFNWHLTTKDKIIQAQSSKINEVKLIVYWQEGKRKGSTSATTCLPNKTE
jgi:Tfp pilus assembly protein PilV